MGDPTWWKNKGRDFVNVFECVVDKEENEEISSLQEETSEEE